MPNNHALTTKRARKKSNGGSAVAGFDIDQAFDAGLRARKALAGIITFGEAMLGENAIDPAYEAIHAARLPLDQQKRLLVVYCLFYHLGSAAYLSQLEGAEFWRIVEVAARNQTPPSATDSALPDGRWPRVPDRRFFRGRKCVAAVQELARKFPRPEDLIDWLIAPEPDTEVLSASVVIKRAEEFKLWGPWAAWKMADLIETLGIAPIVFPLDSRLLPEKPGAVLIDLGGEPALRELAAHFSQIPAPPRFVRNCGLQEIETILCRYGSHLNGTTEVGKNIREIRHDLSGGWGPTADLLLQHMPAEVPEAVDQAATAADHNHALLPAGTVIDGIDCSGMTDDPKRNGVPVYLQTQNRTALTVPAEVTETDGATDQHDPQDADPDDTAITTVTPLDPHPSEITVVNALNPNVIHGDQDHRGPEVPTNKTSYNNTVTEIKNILAQHDKDWRRIGELVAGIEKDYGKNQVVKLAKAVGLKAATLWRYRKVYKLATEIEEKLALGRVLNYSAVRALENHPDPAAEFKKKPDMKQAKAAEIMTDEAKHYYDIVDEYAGHGTVTHSADEYVRHEAWIDKADKLHIEPIHTNTVEGYYSIFKRGMKGVYQHCSEKHLHRYLAEFDFRYNTRTRLGFNDLMRAEALAGEIKGKRLTYRRPHRLAKSSAN